MRFPTEHLAALIKPHLINSDKREKDRRSERVRIGKNLQPRQRFLKKARKRVLVEEQISFSQLTAIAKKIL